MAGKRAWMMATVVLVSAAAVAAPRASFDFAAVPSSAAYQEVSEALDVEVVLDPQLPARVVTLTLDEVTAEEALDAVARAAGHFVADDGRGGLVVADDTPQKRRDYEPLVLRVFQLSHIPVKQADLLLRSLVEARRLASDERHNTLSLRDTAAKVCVAERLLSIADQPEAEVDLSVSLVELAPRAILGGDELPVRLPATEVQRWLASDHVRSLWSGGLGLVGPAKGGLSAQTDDAGFALEVRARTHPGAGTVTLDVEVDSSLQVRTGESSERRQASARSSARLDQGEAMVIRLLDPGRDRWRVLLVAPMRVEPTRFSDNQLEAFRVGTESHIDVRCD